MLSYKTAYAMGAIGLSFATPAQADNHGRSTVRPSENALLFPNDAKAPKKNSRPDRGNHYGYDKGKGHDDRHGKGHGGGHCEDDNRCHASPG